MMMAVVVVIINFFFFFKFSALWQVQTSDGSTSPGFELLICAIISNKHSFFETNCTYSELLRELAMLSNAMYFTVNIVFINFDKHSFNIHIVTLVWPPKGLRNRLVHGPRPKKVVHHCHSPCFRS